jgi:hypothetical protein
MHILPSFMISAMPSCSFLSFDDLHSVGKALADRGVEGDVTELGIAVVKARAVEDRLLENDGDQRR